MEARGRQYSSIKSIFALLTVNLLAVSTAEYVHRHRHGIQSKIYEHPRFGESSIRYCAFNQYFDDREGRCMIIPGGGIAISIDESTTCSSEALRGHPHRSRNYYICRKSNTILAKCGRGKHFENRLKRCTINTRPSIDEEDYDSHHHPYDHLHLPACQRSGRFPVPQDNCTSFYACTSNGFRFFRSIHKCPASTGFDPFDEICTTERACYNDELGSTTAADDRTEMFGWATGLIVATATEPSVDEVQSIHTLKDNYSLNKSTTRFTTISAGPFLSTGRYDEAKISVSFIPASMSTTEKITTATSLPDSMDEVVGIARPTRPPTKVYEDGEETSQFTSTTYVHSLGLSEKTNTSERSPITVATNEIVDTSTASSVLSDDASTVNTSRTINEILYNRYSDDYVTSRSDNAARLEKKNESANDTTVKISTNNKIDEFTVATNEIVDTSTANTVLPDNESTANTSGTNSDEYLPISSSDKKDEFMDETTIDDLGTRKRDGTRTSEANELGIGLQVSYSTESAMDNTTEKWSFDKNVEGATSTIAEEISRRETTEREFDTSLPVSLSSATSDASTRDVRYEEAQFITTPSGISSIEQSSAFIEGSEIKSTAERITFYDAVTLTTPVDSYASSGEVSWKSSSSDGIGGTSISSTEIVDSTPGILTSLAAGNTETTSIQDSNGTTEEESKIGDRYHNSFSSSLTDTSDNGKSTTDGLESTMSTIEPTYITDVTEKFDSTSVTLTSLTPRNNEATSTTEPAYVSELTEKFNSTSVSPTSLTTQNNEATSIQDSNSTTEEEFTMVEHYHDTFSSFSTDRPDDEKSTTAGMESAMSTTEPTYITEITAKFDLPPVSPTSLTTRSNAATSIQDSNSTTEEESTIGDHYHSTFSSFSTDTSDDEKSTTAGMESAISTTESTHITEITEKFDLPPVSPASLTTRSNAATSIQDWNWMTEREFTIADHHPGAFSSFSTDTPDNQKSTNADTESTMSTPEPVHTSEVTENVGTSGILWKSSSTDDPLTSIEQHQSTTGENLAAGASQLDTAQTTEDSVSRINVAISTTCITPSATSEPSQLVNGPTQDSYTTLPHTFTSFSIDSLDNEKSNAPTESAMSTTVSEHISEVTEKAVTYPKITWNSATDDLFTSIEQHQSTTGENLHSAFTYASTLDASQFDKAQTTGNSNPDMNVAVSTTSTTPSLSSETSQLEDGQAQGSYTSASNSSEYPTTVEHPAGATNSLSTTMSSSSD